MKLRFREFERLDSAGHPLCRVTVNAAAIAHIDPHSEGGCVVYFAGCPAGRDWLRVSDAYDEASRWLLGLSA